MNITPTKIVKLPLDKCRGSIEQRRKYVNECMQKIFENITDEVKIQKNVQFDELKEAIDNTVGEGINLKIKRKNFLQDSCLCPANTNTGENRIDSYFMMLPSPIIGKNRCTIDNIVTLYHETMHCIDLLFNPKYVSTLEHTDKMPAAKKIEKIFAKNLYPGRGDVSNLRKNLENDLEKFNKEERISILKTMRDALELEIHAGLDSIWLGIKHQTRLLMKFGINPSVEESLNNHNSFRLDSYEKLNLEEKLKIVKSLLAKTLKEAREELAVQNSAKAG